MVRRHYISIFQYVASCDYEESLCCTTNSQQYLQRELPEANHAFSTCQSITVISQSLSQTTVPIASSPSLSGFSNVSLGSSLLVSSEPSFSESPSAGWTPPFDGTPQSDEASILQLLEPPLDHEYTTQLRSECLQSITVGGEATPQDRYCHALVADHFESQMSPPAKRKRNTPSANLAGNQEWTYCWNVGIPNDKPEQMTTTMTTTTTTATSTTSTTAATTATATTTTTNVAPPFRWGRSLQHEFEQCNHCQQLCNEHQAHLSAVHEPELAIVLGKRWIEQWFRARFRIQMPSISELSEVRSEDTVGNCSTELEFRPETFTRAEFLASELNPFLTSVSLSPLRHKDPLYRWFCRDILQLASDRTTARFTVQRVLSDSQFKKNLKALISE